MKAQLFIIAAIFALSVGSDAIAGNTISINTTGAVEYQSNPTSMVCQYLSGAIAQSCTGTTIKPSIFQAQICDIGTVSPQTGGKIRCTPSYGFIYGNAKLNHITCTMTASNAVVMDSSNVSCVCSYSGNNNLSACQWK